VPVERQNGAQVKPFILGQKGVVFTHLERTYFPAAGYTKAEVLDYYLQIAPYLLPHVKDRPLTLERYPEGIQNGSFFQKNASSYFPPWLRTFPVERRDGKRIVHFPLVDDEADLLYLVNQGTITFHTQMSRTTDPGHPDVMVLDVDPPELDGPEGAAAGKKPHSSAQFRLAAEVAMLLREQLKTAGFDPVVKTSGKRGLHLAFGLDGRMDYTEARAQLGRLFAELAARNPKLLTTLIRKNKREGRVYLDALRMSPGATIVPPYVVRPTAEATVSMPITWEELDSLENGRAFTIKTAPARLARTGDLWTGLTGRERSAE
jgi:bifunctional non-homologous end joining protein LigD